MITVTLPGLTLTNATDTGADPYLVDLPGWFDSVDVNLDLVERSRAHGWFDQDAVFDQGRLFSVAGQVIDPGNPISVFTHRTTIMSLKSITGQWQVSVTDPTGTYTAMVRVAGKIRYLISNEESGVAEFEIPLIAADPRKYGPPLAPFTGLAVAGTGYVWPAVWPADWGSGGDPGRVSAINSGTETTYPVLEAVGGLGDGVELVEIVTGSTLRLERDIPVTSTVFFDTRTGRAYLDVPANDISGFLTRREWAGFAIPGGSTRTVQFNSLGVTSGTPHLTVRYSPAY